MDPWSDNYAAVLTFLNSRTLLPLTPSLGIGEKKSAGPFLSAASIFICFSIWAKNSSEVCRFYLSTQTSTEILSALLRVNQPPTRHNRNCVNLEWPRQTDITNFSRENMFVSETHCTFAPTSSSKGKCLQTVQPVWSADIINEQLFNKISSLTTLLTTLLCISSSLHPTN